MKIAVYTALLGGYEKPILEDWLSADGNVDFFYFTDGDLSAAGHWNVVNVEPRILGDPVRSARYLKIMGHPVLSEYDVTVWIDNRVRLRIPASVAVSRFLGSDSVFSLPYHSHRRDLREEFETVLKYRMDDPRRIREQYVEYQRWFKGSLDLGVYWTAILIRRADPDVSRLSSMWWEHVLRYSRRDQLSLPVVECLTGTTLRGFVLDNYYSDLHEWIGLNEIGRSASIAHWSPVSLKAEVADLAYDGYRKVKRNCLSFVGARK